MRLKKLGRDLLCRNVGLGSLMDEQYWKQNVSWRGCEREGHKIDNMLYKQMA